MRAVIQRVGEASVMVGEESLGRIGRGFLVLLGCEEGDDEEDLDWLVGKVCRLRVFEDVAGRMNLDLAAIGGQVLVVSQFTLHASTRKGNRPSFVRAAPPEVAEPMYEAFCERLGAQIGQSVQRGRFAAHMRVALVNEGPVTIVIDSRMRE